MSVCTHFPWKKVGTPIQNHIDEFNYIIFNLESLNVKIEDEDKAILLVVSLPPSISISRKFCCTVTVILLSFEDVRLT